MLEEIGQQINIEYKHADNLTSEEFMKDYIFRGEPLVIIKAYNQSDEKLFKPESYLDEGEVPLYSDNM